MQHFTVSLRFWGSVLALLKSMSKQWTSVWLGLLPAYLIISLETHYIVSETIAKEYSKEYWYIWLKIYNLRQTEKKKKHGRNASTTWSYSSPERSLFSKLMLIGKFLPTFCHAKLILSNCSHWNHKNLFYYIKGTYKSLHDLNHRYEPLQPGKYKQQHCNTPGTVPNVKQCLWTLKIRHRIA